MEHGTWNIEYKQNILRVKVKKDRVHLKYANRTLLTI